MRIPEKENAIIVRGVVIPCGLTDETGDKPQTKKDIKKIFTNYLAHETDVQHAWVNNYGVYTLENTLTETETIIAGQTVPANSWIASHLVINPNIQKMIKNKELNAYSLGAVNDKLLRDNRDVLIKNFLNKSLRYEDLNDAEELNPIFISFVDKPANGFNWEYYDYHSFLEKNYSGENMTENEVVVNETSNTGFVSEGLFERVISRFMNKSEETTIDEEEVPDDVETETMEKEDESTDSSNKELLEQLPGAVAEAVIKALTDAAQMEKSDDESENETENDDEEDETMNKSMEDSTPREENRMEKSTTKTVSDTTIERPESTIQVKTERDRFGRNIRYL